MVRNIDDVKTELRKLTNAKPVNAVAGAGVLASQALKELPWRLVQWTRENPPETLPGRANGYMQQARANANGYVQQARTNANGYMQQARANANGYMQQARTRASGGYDKLAEHGKKALNGAPNGTPVQTATPSQSGLNGKPKGKAPSRTATSK